MYRYTIRTFVVCSAIVSLVWCADDAILFPANENANYPQQGNDGVDSRSIFPSNKKFSIGLGRNNGYSVGVSRTPDGGLSFSQSTSVGASDNLATSQSNSFSVGRNGVAASDANAYNVFGNADANTNAYSVGDANATSQADVKDGRVSSGAQSYVGNEDNKVSSGASSSAGNGGATADADASAVQNQQYSNRGLFRQNRPQGFHLFRPLHQSESSSGLRINIGKYHPHNPQFQNSGLDIQINKWRPTRGLPWHGTNFAPANSNPWPQPYPADGSYNQYPSQPVGSWPQQNGPSSYPSGGTRVASASASSSASSSGRGHASSHSSSHSNVGPNGPSSQTYNNVHTSGDAQGHAQGVAAGLQDTNNEQTLGTFSSGSISGNSHGHGQSSGSAIAENQGEHSRGEVNSSAHGQANAGGSANAAGVADDGSANDYTRQDDIIPSEFVRSGLDDDVQQPTGRDNGKNSNNPREQEKRGHIRRILSNINNAVSSIFKH